MAVFDLVPPRTEAESDLAQSAFRRAGFQTHHVGIDEAEHHPHLAGKRIAASQELGGQEMTDKPATSREAIESSITALIGLGGALNHGIADELCALLDKCDAAIARAERAEAALEAARIEACRWGIDAVFDICWLQSAHPVMDEIHHLNPAQIVKEHER